MFLSALSSLVALFLAWVFLSHSRSSRKKGLPSGSLGWPVVGETLQFLASKPTLTSQPFVEKRASRYGDIFKTHLFGQPFIVSTNTETNLFILQNEGRLFRSSYPIKAYRDILGKETFVETHGNLHKSLHAAAAQFLSSDEIKGSAFDFIQTLIMKRLPTWQDQIVHVQPEATYMVLCVLLDRLISQDPESLDVQQLQNWCNDVKAILAFPYNVPGSGYSKHTQGRASLLKYLEDRIAERRKLHEFKSKDFLGVLLKEEDEGLFATKSKLILDTIVGILFHGEDTTGMALTLMMKFLSNSPQAFNQVREEQIAIRKKKGREERLVWEDYESMKFTKSVINETLRMANLLPWLVRVATEDVEIKGHTIPKGWKVLVFLMGTHFDRTVYSDPETFNPWRWQDSAGDTHFTAFGNGPRSCPGADLARVTLAVFLHLLVTKYSWQLVEEDDLIRFPALTFQEGLPIVVKNMNDEDECLILH